MSRITCACLSVCLMGCGPTADDGNEGEKTAGGSTSHAEPADSSDSDVPGTSSTDTSDASTGVETAADEPLTPSEHVSAEIRCQDDGLAQMLVETNVGLEGPRAETCSFLGLEDGYLLIAIRDWHGGPAEFDIPGDHAQAATEDEPLEGTVTIEAFAPLHPTIMHVDLAGETTTLRGTLDLQTCGHIPDHC